MDSMDPSYIQLEMENERLRAELERERMRLVACGVAADANTRMSANVSRIYSDSKYWSAAYNAVCNAIDREMMLRDERDEYKERAEKAERERDEVFRKYDGRKNLVHELTTITADRDRWKRACEGMANHFLDERADIIQDKIDYFYRKATSDDTKL